MKTKLVDFILGAAAAAILMFSTFAAAADSPVSIARVFIGQCVNNYGEFDRISAGAKALGYRELTGDQLLMLGPQDRSAESAGWLVEKGEGAPYFLGVSSGKVDGKFLMTCSIAQPDVDMDKVLREVVELAVIGEKIEDIVQSGQRYRTFLANTKQHGSKISVMDGRPVGIVGGTITFIVPFTE